MREHTENEPTSICDICQQNFVTKKTIIDHVGWNINTHRLVKVDHYTSTEKGPEYNVNYVYLHVAKDTKWRNTHVTLMT